MEYEPTRPLNSNTPGCITVWGNQVYLKQAPKIINQNAGPITNPADLANTNPIQYSTDNLIWTDILVWPVIFQTTDTTISNDNRLIITITSNLDLPALDNGKTRIIIGQPNTTIDGQGNTVSVGYLNRSFYGLVQNGSGPNLSNTARQLEKGFDNVTIKNLEISGYSANLQQDSGYLAHAYFGCGASNNLIVNCYNLTDFANSYTGGIVGSYAGSNGGHLTISNCYNLGLQKEFTGGIVSQKAGENNGTVIVTNCYNTSPIDIKYNTGWSTGGIFGPEAGTSGTVIVSNCYFNGPINKIAPNIPGGKSSNVTFIDVYAYNGNWNDNEALETLFNPLNDIIWINLPEHINFPFLLASFGKTKLDKTNYFVPTLLYIEPKFGLVNTPYSIKIYGNNLHGVKKVLCDNIEILNFTISTDYSYILVNLPSHPAGYGAIELVSDIGKSNLDYFYYNESDIKIDSITPSSAKPLSQVTIKGSGFVDIPPTGAIIFTNYLNVLNVTTTFFPSINESHPYLSPSYTVVDSNTIVATVPMTLYVGPANIKIFTANNKLVKNNCFTYEANINYYVIQPASTSSDFTIKPYPFDLIKGGSVIILNINTIYDVSSVKIGNNKCINFSLVGNSLTFIAPQSNVSGFVDININHRSGTLTMQNFFYYIDGIPKITDIIKYSTSSYSNQYRIIGENLFPPLTVTVNNRNLPVMQYVIPGKEIIIDLLAFQSKPGTRKVTVTSFGQKTNEYTFIQGNAQTPVIPAPTISNVTPHYFLTSGETQVTIDGTSFFEPETMVIKFNDTTVLSSDINVENQGRIKTKAPASVNSGSVNVYVKTIGGEVSYTGLQYVDMPTIISVEPSSGSWLKNIPVTIKGTNFFDVSSVTFNDVPVLDFTLIDSETITATTPTSDKPDFATIKIIAFDTVISDSTLYEYLDSIGPTISHIYWKDTEWPFRYEGISGQTPITIIGSNLDNLFDVTINDTVCFIIPPPNNSDGTSAGLTYGSTRIDLYTPRSELMGPAKIVIRTIDGTSRAYTNFYKYVEAPTIISLDKYAASLIVPTQITITGTNFFVDNNNPTFSLSVDGIMVASSEIIINSDTSITFTAPVKNPSNNLIKGNAYIRIYTVGGDTITEYEQFKYHGPPKIISLSPNVVSGPEKDAGTISPFVVGNQIWTTEDIQLPQVTHNGTGTITWTSTPANVISINPIANTWKMLARGKVTLIATLADTEGYTSATASSTFSIGKINAQITPFIIGTTPYETYSTDYSTTPIQLTLPTVTVGTGMIQYIVDVGNVGDFNQANQTNGQITMRKAGTITITARLNETDNYNEVTKTLTVVINKAQSSLSDFGFFNGTNLSNTLVYNPNYFTPTNLPRVAIGNGTISYSSSDTTIVDINGSTGVIQMKKAGVVTIIATVTETEQYLSSASKTVALTIEKAQGTISGFGPIEPKTFTPAFFTLPKPTQTGDSTVEYSSSDPTIVTINNERQITMVKAGTVTLTAKLLENDKYKQMQITTQLVVTKASGTLSRLATLGTKTYNPTSFKPDNLPRILNTNGGYGSNGIIGYSSSNSEIASIDSTGTITMGKAGTVTITTSLSGTDQYSGTSEQTTLTVVKSDINYSWVGGLSKAFNANAYNLTNDELVNIISVNYDGNVNYTISDNSIASIDSAGSSIKLSTIKAGKCTITATLSGSSRYNDNTRTIDLSITKFQGTLTGFNINTSITYTSIPFYPTLPTKTGNGIIEYSSSNPAVASIDISTGQVTLHAAGSFTLKAKLLPTEQYSGTEVLINSKVIKEQGLMTDFSALPDAVFGCDNYIPLNLPQIITGNGTITYSSSNQGIVSVNSTTCEITVKRAGTVTITATLSETAQYASSIKTTTLQVKPAVSQVSNFTFPEVTYDANRIYYPSSYPTVIKGDGNFTYSILSGSDCVESINTTNCGIKLKKAGEVQIRAILNTSKNYESNFIDTWFTIIKAEGKFIPLLMEYNYDYNPVPVTSSRLGKNIITDGDGSLTFSIEDTSVATINSETGQIQMLKAGNTTIKVTLSETPRYTGMERTAPLKINKIRRNLNWGKSVSTLYMINFPLNPPSLSGIYNNSDNFQYIVTGNANYDSANNNLEIYTPGDITIIATLLESERYYECSVVKNIFVNKITASIEEMVVTSGQVTNLVYNSIGHPITIEIPTITYFPTLTIISTSLNIPQLTWSMSGATKTTGPNTNSAYFIINSSGFIKASITGNEHFRIINSYTEINFEVVKANITLDWHNYFKIHNDSKTYYIGIPYIKLPDGSTSRDISDYRKFTVSSDKSDVSVSLIDILDYVSDTVGFFVIRVSFFMSSAKSVNITVRFLNSDKYNDNSITKNLTVI